MSSHHWFEGEEEQPETPRPTSEPQRRSRALFITAIALIILFIGGTGFAAFWTERLWFQSVGYSSVFSTVIWTRVGLFLVFGAAMALVVGGTMVLAYRTRPIFRPVSNEQAGLDRYREAIVPIRWLLLAGSALVLGIFAGASASGEWRTFLLWRNGSEFGATDPFFERDAGFYMFSLPWLHYLTDFVMAAALVALIAGALVHYLFGGIQLQNRHDKMSPAAQVQMSVLLGVFVLAKAGDYYLDRYDTLNGSGGLIDGATYTDVNAVIPAKNILLWIAIICAVLFAVNIWRRSWRLPMIGISLLVVSAIILGMVWPGLVQRFQVTPSQAVKEREYIQANIDATRASFDIEDVEQTSYPGSVDVEPQQLRDEAVRVGIRLVDPSLVAETFEQTQQVKGYYSVPEVLDVDRYDIQGEERDVVVAVRELNQQGIPESAQNWANLHTVYTHGYGLIAAFGNQRGVDNESQTTSSEGLAWAEENLPPTGQLTELGGEDGYRPQVYFGEQSPTYSIVGRAPGGSDIELDLPDGPTGQGEETQTTYDGPAGVDVGSFPRKLLYAVKFGEPNFILSNLVHENSKVLYDRDPTQMVQKVAPWLSVDRDPFPAMVDGRIVWILDGYTVSDRYPQADKQSFDAMTDDALADEGGFQTVPTDEINYMRNAVKAVVDAYDGTVTLYAWDEEDPILNAWTQAFPDTVLPRSEIPESLLEHMRYPEDLFKVQRYQMAAYHVENADDFYQRNDEWEVPQDPNSDASLQPPYRLSVAMPRVDEEGNAEQGDPTFSLTSVYTPAEKQNLQAFLSVDSDAADEDYGRMRVLTLRGGEQVPGPGQISNNFAADDAVKEALLRFTNDGSTQVKYGNLLTLPVGEGLMYVQPIYTVRTDGVGNYPQLRFVVVSFGSAVGFGTTLEEAIDDILGVPTDQGGEQAGDTGADQGDAGDAGAGAPTGTLSAAVRDKLEEAIAEFRRADQLQRQGDTAGWAEALENAEQLVDDARELADAEAAAGGADGGAGGGADGGGQDQQTGDGRPGSGGGRRAPLRPPDPGVHHGWWMLDPDTSGDRAREDGRRPWPERRGGRWPRPAQRCSCWASRPPAVRTSPSGRPTPPHPARGPRRRCPQARSTR